MQCQIGVAECTRCPSLGERSPSVFFLPAFFSISYIHNEVGFIQETCNQRPCSVDANLQVKKLFLRSSRSILSLLFLSLSSPAPPFPAPSFPNHNNAHPVRSLFQSLSIPRSRQRSRSHSRLFEQTRCDDDDKRSLQERRLQE